MVLWSILLMKENTHMNTNDNNIDKNIQQLQLEIEKLKLLMTMSGDMSENPFVLNEITLNKQKVLSNRKIIFLANLKYSRKSLTAITAVIGGIAAILGSLLLGFKVGEMAVIATTWTGLITFVGSVWGLGNTMDKKIYATQSSYLATSASNINPNAIVSNTNNSNINPNTIVSNINPNAINSNITNVPLP